MKTSSHNSVTKKKIQLILIDKNNYVIYIKKCKIIVDKIEERIVITPKKHNGAKDIVVKFGENFRQHNKCLFSWSSEDEGCNFVLIFPREIICTKIFNILYKVEIDSTIINLTNKILQNKFIIPFFKTIHINKKMKAILNPLILLFLNSLTNKQKQNCFIEMKEVDGIDKNLIQKYFDAHGSCNGENDTNSRKRNWKRIYNSGNNDLNESEEESDNSVNKKTKNSDEEICFNSKKRKIITYLSDVVKSPNFKIIHFQKRNRSRPKLIVFPSADDKTKCYEYYWCNKKKIYLCCGCSIMRKQIRAKVIYQNGKECVKLQSAKHVCEIRKYDSEKHDDFEPSKLIVEKPNFEIFSYTKNGIPKKTLVIFDPTNKKLCHEYFWHSKIDIFECCGCALKFKQITAKIVAQKDKKECIQLSKRKHICDLREFNPKKFTENEKIIEKSNFEIATYDRKGVCREKLIIFPSAENRKQCYEYFWNTPSKKFICAGCSNLGKHLFAKIGEADDGRKVVKLSSTDHICEIREFNADKYKKDEIVEAPNYVIIKSEFEELSKSILFVFCPSNKTLGYEYSWDPRNDCYFCLGCHGYSKRTTATECKESTGKEYVKLSKTVHICSLREYDLEKFKPKIIIKKPNYEYHEQILCGAIKKKLFIFTSKEEKLGYKFACEESRKTAYFYCIKCSALKHHIPAHIYVDKNGEEYISVRDKKHICNPCKYLSNEFENRKIIESPNYQIIQRNIRNRLMERLIIFDLDDKNLCYEYTKGQKSYVCNICQYHHKHNVFARLISTDGKEHIEFGPNEHKCKPIKFEPPEALTVHLPNFKIENITKNDSTRKSLVIYSSENIKLKYNYRFENKYKSFVCGKCSKKNKRITAKLLKNENGEDYLELNSRDHLCKPC